MMQKMSKLRKLMSGSELRKSLNQLKRKMNQINNRLVEKAICKFLMINSKLTIFRTTCKMLIRICLDSPHK